MSDDDLPAVVSLLDDQTVRTVLRETSNHDTVYQATLDQVSIRLRNGELEFTVERREIDPADQ